MGRLHECHQRVDKETQGLLEKVPGGCVVGIEQRNVLGLTLIQGVVDIAGLGVAIIAAGEAM